MKNGIRLLAFVLAGGAMAHAQDNVDSAPASTSPGLEEIMVYGRMPDTVNDIPQSVSVFNREMIDLSPTNSVGDVIRFVPTASRNGSTLNAFGDDYLIRGFGANQTINGLGLNRVAHARDTANVERIEVLKGPAAVLFGQMEPGAVINVVTKQPLDYFYAEAGVEAGSHDHQRYTVDVTGPLSDKVKGRLNVAYQDSESFVDFWAFERLFVAPNLSVELTPSTDLVVEGSYTSNDWDSFQNGNPASGAFLPNPHGDYSQSFNPDEDDIGFTRRDSADLNFRLNQQLGDDLALRASYTYTRNEADFKETFVARLRDDNRTIDRAIFVGEDGFENDHNVLLDLTGHVSTGVLSHEYIAGLNYREFDSSRPTRFVFSTPLDLFAPAYGLAPDVDPELPDFFQNFVAMEGFIQDRISISERFHLIAGLRYTDAEQEAERVSTSGDSSIDELNETNWTTQLGVLFDLTQNLSVFANRSESFVPQFGTSTGGKPFDAEESVQHEIGTRFDIGSSGLQANAAIFSITKDNLTTSDPSNPGFDATLGEVESKGFELAVNGYILSNWLFSAAYGYTETEITRNPDGLEGNTLRNTPENTFSLQSRYEIGSGALQGLGLGGTVEYADERYGDDDNSFKLPSHTRVDVGAFYAITANAQLDLLVNNAFDEDVFLEGFTTARVIREPGRSAMMRLKLQY